MIDCYPQMFDLSDWSWMSQRFSQCLFPLYTRQNPSIFLALEQPAWHPISSWKSSLLSSLKKFKILNSLTHFCGRKISKFKNQAFCSWKIEEKLLRTFKNKQYCCSIEFWEQARSNIWSSTCIIRRFGWIIVTMRVFLQIKWPEQSKY